MTASVTESGAGREAHLIHPQKSFSLLLAAYQEKRGFPDAHEPCRIRLPFMAGEQSLGTWMYPHHARIPNRTKTGE